MVRRSKGQDLELVWIDFQDAMLGPRVYDLVALLNDSYQTFTVAFVNQRLADYLCYRNLPVSEFRQLSFEFNWITLQRKLKDAGRFVFIDRVKGNSSFLPFVMPTIAKVRSALSNLQGDPILGALDDCLATWVDRLRTKQSV
jgi:hypothetical protein